MSKNEEYNDIYGRMGECICCHNTNSVEHDEVNECYFCNSCHMIFSAETYEGWLAGEEVTFDYENGDYFCDPDKYAPVYDEDGNEVLTPCCGVPMKWDDENYICPECGETISRYDFFSMIGAQLPGEMCYTCQELYPCMSCYLGYEIEEKF